MLSEGARMEISDEEIDSDTDSYGSASLTSSFTESLSPNACDGKRCFSYAPLPPSKPTASNGTTNKSKCLNILQKLYSREVYGNFSPRLRTPNQRMFDTVPNRNRIRLLDVLPLYAFEQNHIFMGISKCGNFLLTYTMDIDSAVCSQLYKYRLHWWLFIPFATAPARKVAEVMLFANQEVHCELHISISQWPTDYARLLVYGYCNGNCLSGHSHVTMTTVPALNKCQDCFNVAASYEEDDLAADWDGCVRLSCLKHGLTVHTHFEVVSPYPMFDAHIHMRRDGVVLFNTGNFLHVLRAHLENVGGGQAAAGGARRQADQDDKTGDSSTANIANTLETFDRADEAVLLADSSDQPSNRMGDFLETCSMVPVAKCLDSAASSCGNLLSGLVAGSGDGIKREDFWTRPETKSDTGSEKSFQSAESGSDRCDSSGGRRSDSGGRSDKKRWESRPTASGEKGDVFPAARAAVRFNRDVFREARDDDELELTTCSKVAYDEGRAVVKSELFNSVSKRAGACDEDELSAFSRLTEGDKWIAMTTADVKSEVTSDDSRDGENLEVKPSSARPPHRAPAEENLTDREKILRDFSDEVFLGQGVKRSSTSATSRADHRCGSGLDNAKRVRMATPFRDGPAQSDEDCLSRRHRPDASLDSRATPHRLDAGKVDAPPDDLRLRPTYADIKKEMDLDYGGFSPTAAQLNITVPPPSPSPDGYRSPDAFTLLMMTTTSRLPPPHDDSDNSSSPTVPRCKRDGGRRGSGQRRLRLGSPAPQLPPTPIKHHAANAAAETIYEFTEDATPDSCEKLSSYRRRRLAEKKYEFCEEEGEDAENIVPYGVHRRRESSPASRVPRTPPMYLPPTPLQIKHPACSPRSPGGGGGGGDGAGADQDKSVLRPFNRNVAGICLLSPKQGGKKAAAADVAPAAAKPTAREEAHPAGDPAPADQPNKFTCQYYRRYMEVDDELVSVITDIEDEDGQTGSPAYQLALPLEVHGSGCSQLQMISQCKAEKLMAPGVVVHQVSFDVERFCSDFAQGLCERAGKRYSFCNDYDVEVVDVCPNTGDVMVKAMMRIQILLLEGIQAHQQYTGECTFVWNMDTGEYRIIQSTPLITDKSPFKPWCDEPWGPAQKEVLKLRKAASGKAVPTRSAVRTISNELTFQDTSLLSVVDPDNLFKFEL